MNCSPVAGTQSQQMSSDPQKTFIGLTETPCLYRECRSVLEKSVKNTKCTCWVIFALTM